MIKVGQMWRTRGGDMVCVTARTDKGSYVISIDGESGNTWVDSDGRYYSEGHDDEFDLVEQISRVYIAGPMTGLPELNFPAFHVAAAEYRNRGCFVINPAEFGPFDEWTDAMRADIAELVTCEMLVLLPGYKDSKCASLELHIAQSLNMAIVWPE